MGLFPWYTEHSPDRVIPWTSEFPDDVYSLGDVLGKGSFGSVFECVEKKTGQCLACKVILKNLIRNEEDKWELRREMQIMRELGCHCNIVSLQRVYEDPSAIYFVMERCSGGDLLGYISRRGQVPEVEAAKIFRQLVTAVAFCHEHGVVHRDLKPDNVLITRQQSEPSPPADPSSDDLSTLKEPLSSVFAAFFHSSDQSCKSPVANAESGAVQSSLQVKLTDFGQAVTCRREGFIGGAAGSLPYTAPELLCRLKYNEKVDVWSLGVILYTMLAGRWPFYSSKRSIMKKLICAGQLDVVSGPWHSISAEAEGLVKRMLAVNPSHRPSCRELLQHPWLR
ncbi:hypothetical protein CLOM_g22587 [Closterium sp. NIES-68]|nr:hypothetical protein CLOM_g22587 [Closterium sp. NIES-68]GJP79394.1 hypothetical protein CLOP_g9628 [Closterium sp. NIES-67]